MVPLLIAVPLLGNRISAPFVSSDTGTSSSPRPLVSLHMVTATTGWAVAEDALYRIDDGGQTFEDVTPRLPRGVRPFSVSVVSDLGAWVATTSLHGGLLLETQNAGRTWRRVQVPTRDRFDFADVFFVDAVHGWFATSSAGMQDYDLRLYRTVDGGARWDYLPRRQSGCKSILAFANANTGYCTTAVGGGSVPAWRPIYISSDGGRTWRIPHLTVAPAYRTTTAFSDAQAPSIVSGRDAVMAVSLYTNRISRRDRNVITAYRTTDAGAHWSATSPLDLGTGGTQAEMDWVDLRRGWSAVGCTLYRTTDGGYRWQRLRLPSHLGVRALDFVNARSGFALPCPPRAGRVKLLRTGDGGESWHTIVPTVSG